MNPKQLLAGTAIVDITPPLSNLIYGDFISHYSQTNHEKLYSKALALKGSEETVVLVLVDICYVQDLFFRSIRKDLEQKTGLPEKNFLFCYTHTHSADLLHNASNLPYLRKLFVLIIDSVISALGKLVPAKISFGSADVSKYFVCNKCLTQKGYETNYTVKGKSDFSITTFMMRKT